MINLALLEELPLVRGILNTTIQGLSPETVASQEGMGSGVANRGTTVLKLCRVGERKNGYGDLGSTTKYHSKEVGLTSHWTEGCHRYHLPYQLGLDIKLKLLHCWINMHDATCFIP